jgi:hypothetical protein
MRPSQKVANDGKAKTGEIAEFIVINEYFEPVFSAEFVSAVLLRQPLMVLRLFMKLKVCARRKLLTKSANYPIRKKGDI